jgi:hypothetical protein
MPISDPAAQVDRVGFDAEGRIVVLAHSGTGAERRSMIGVARANEPMVLRALTFVVNDVMMADADRGLAVGATLRDVAETHDGGGSWSRVEDPAFDGDPASLSLGAPNDPSDEPVHRAGAWVECSPTVCRVGEHLVHRWDATGEVVPPLP